MVQGDRHNFYPQNSRNASVCNLTFFLSLKTGFCLCFEKSKCSFYSFLQKLIYYHHHKKFTLRMDLVLQLGLDVHKKLSYHSMVDGEGTEVKRGTG